MPASLVAVLDSLVAADWFHDQGSVATLRPSYPLSGVLPASLEPRLEGASPAVVRAAELVAVGGEIADATLTRLVGTEVVADAEDRGLVRGDDAGSELHWRPANPLLGELVRASLTDQQSRSRQSELAAVLEADDLRTADALLVRGEVAAATGCGEPEALGLVLDAAEVALDRADAGRAITLARAAWEDGASIEGGLLLGSALELAGDIEGRATVAAEAGRRATGPRERVIAAEQLATALANLDRVADATAAIEKARASVGDPIWAARLDALAANLHLHAARLDQAIATAEPYLAVPLAAADAATLVGVAHAVGGQSAAALEAVEIGASALDRGRRRAPDRDPRARAHRRRHRPYGGRRLRRRRRSRHPGVRGERRSQRPHCPSLGCAHPRARRVAAGHGEERDPLVP